jgi:hypothetical protein
MKTQIRKRKTSLIDEEEHSCSQDDDDDLYFSKPEGTGSPTKLNRGQDPGQLTSDFSDGASVLNQGI